VNVQQQQLPVWTQLKEIPSVEGEHLQQQQLPVWTQLKKIPSVEEEHLQPQPRLAVEKLLAEGEHLEQRLPLP